MSASFKAATALVMSMSLCPFRSFAQWKQVNPPSIGPVYSLAARDTVLFAGTMNGGVLLSTDDGTSWSNANAGLTNQTVYALAMDGMNVFAGTRGGGVFRSTDNGASWAAMNEGLTDPYVATLAMCGTNLFAGTYAFGGGVFRSSDNGTSWTSMNVGLTNTLVYALAICPPAMAERISSQALTAAACFAPPTMVHTGSL